MKGGFRERGERVSDSGGVNINIGSEKSTLQRSAIHIQDITGSKTETKDPIAELTQRLWDELTDAKQRIRTIEQYIAGSPLGEPGLTLQVRELKADLKRIENVIGLATALDDRIASMEARMANVEAILLNYTRNNVSIDKWVFLAVVALLFLAIPATFLLIWLGRGSP